MVDNILIIVLALFGYTGLIVLYEMQVISTAFFVLGFGVATICIAIIISQTKDKE